MGASENQVRGAGTEHARDQDWAAAIAITEPAPDRSGEELAQRIGAEYRRDDGRRSTELRGHVGNQRNQDPESQYIDYADEAQRGQRREPQRRPARSLAGGLQSRVLRRATQCRGTS